jgi:hypothetical protein
MARRKINTSTAPDATAVAPGNPAAPVEMPLNPAAKAVRATGMKNQLDLQKKLRIKRSGGM